MNGLFSFHDETAPMGQDILIIEASLAYTPHSVGLIWTSGQPDAETFTLKYTHTDKRRTAMPRRDTNIQFQQASCHRSTP